MISLGLAKKLKDAGLKWKPEIGDWFFYETSGICLFDNDDMNYYGTTEQKRRFKTNSTWLPSLSDILAEIERKHRDFRIKKLMDVWSLDLFGLGMEGEFAAETPEEVAGQALLWILNKGGEKLECKDS